MANWSKIANLLAKEMILWEQMEEKNRRQMQSFKERNSSLEGLEQYLEEKDRLLESLLEIQFEMDNLRLSIEQERAWTEEALHQDIIKKTKRLVDLQAEIVGQEKAMKLYFQKAGDEIREQIKSFRGRKVANHSYNPITIPVESALLDEKK